MFYTFLLETIMRKFLLLPIFTALLFSAVNAQTDISTKTFNRTNEEFSLEAPANLELKRAWGIDENGSRMYRADANGAYFFITSGKNIDIAHFKELLQFAADNNATASTGTINSLNAKKFSFTDSENFHQIILAVQGIKRFYIFHTVSETSDNPAVEIFFKTLKFEESNSVKEFPQIEITSNPGTTVVEKSEVSNSNRGTGSGGAGSATGSGNKENSSSTDNAANKQTSDLKILTKPRADYTNLARYYGIQGAVKLSLIFFPDGTIEVIILSSKLPFGLTNSVIKAAKSIRFQPAIRDGEPYAVTKLVEYQFSLI